MTLGKYSTKPKLNFNYYGRFNISGDELELAHLGRLQWSGRVIREKMTRKDYEAILRKREKKQFARRTKGRLLFRGAKAVVEDETLAEDETFGDARRAVKRGRRTAAMSARRSIRTLKLQNNMYYRLELSKEKQTVLQDKRGRGKKKTAERGTEKCEIKRTEEKAEKADGPAARHRAG